MRIDNSRNPKRIFKYRPEGKRKAGRPKRRWTDSLDEDLRACGLSLYGKTTGRQRTTLEEIASDRGKWKDVIEKSVTGDSRWMTT